MGRVAPQSGAEMIDRLIGAPLLEQNLRHQAIGFGVCRNRVQEFPELGLRFFDLTLPKQSLRQRLADATRSWDRYLNAACICSICFVSSGFGRTVRASSLWAASNCGLSSQRSWYAVFASGMRPSPAYARAEEVVGGRQPCGLALTTGRGAPEGGISFPFVQIRLSPNQAGFGELRRL